ncbi:hypothetical protein Bca52824_033336 [Brassica carinata]|uniref:Uncharacterized protein n=1 Tax=Brassica carinata TaxID=52824 RepID=A0A8X7SDR5_BRACI|nr:hypothetical protein Bca52824_033336 [Brassica carinata]
MEGCSCHELEPPNHSNGDVFDSFHSLRLKSSEKKLSPAIHSLQGYYGLKPTNRTVSVLVIEGSSCASRLYDCWRKVYGFQTVLIFTYFFPTSFPWEEKSCQVCIDAGMRTTAVGLGVEAMSLGLDFCSQDLLCL